MGDDDSVGSDDQLRLSELQEHLDKLIEEQPPSLFSKLRRMRLWISSLLAAGLLAAAPQHVPVQVALGLPAWILWLLYMLPHTDHKYNERLALRTRIDALVVLLPSLDQPKAQLAMNDIVQRFARVADLSIFGNGPHGLSSFDNEEEPQEE